MLLQLFQQNHELHGKVAELQQLAELSRETHVEREKERLNAMSSEKEQRERQIENLRSELATAIGANVELEENIKQYEKLKLDYIELDKICKESTSEIASLKTQNEKLRQDLEKTTALVTEFRENAHVNRAQVIFGFYYKEKLDIVSFHFISFSVKFSDTILSWNASNAKKWFLSENN